MKKSNHLIVLVSIITMALSVLACGASAPSRPAEAQAVQPSATQVPVENKTSSKAAVACAQLLPQDELNNLISNAPATLKETSYPGGTSCEWQYTPNGGSQASLFYVQTDSGGDPSLWEATRKSELSNEPSDIVVNSIDGLGSESYVWTSKITGQYVVYARQGDKTLIMRFNPADILYMNNESGIIDMATRIFSRF